MQFVAVLQCVALCGSVLQCVATCCGVLRRVAACCSVLQRVAACCSMLQHVAVCCRVLPRVAVCYFLVCATWLIHMSDVTHLFVWHNPSISLPWHIHTCTMTQSVSLSHTHQRVCEEQEAEHATWDSRMQGGICHFLRILLVWNVLQCFAVCWSVLRFIVFCGSCWYEVCCKMLQFLAVFCGSSFFADPAGMIIVLQCFSVCCSVLQCVAVHRFWWILLVWAVCCGVCCNVLQCVAVCVTVCCSVCCSVLQCVAVCCCVVNMRQTENWQHDIYSPTHTHTHTHTHIHTHIHTHTHTQAHTHIHTHTHTHTHIHHAHTHSDMIYLHAWHDSFICLTFIFATWFIHMCDMTRSYIWHGMSRSYVWHNSWMCVTWHMAGVVKMNAYAWVMAHRWMSHATYVNDSGHTYESVMAYIRRKSWHTCAGVMAHTCMSHGTHMKELWYIHE